MSKKVELKHLESCCTNSTTRNICPCSKKGGCHPKWCKCSCGVDWDKCYNLAESYFFEKTGTKMKTVKRQENSP